jgi:hypothetical protein
MSRPSTIASAPPTVVGARPTVVGAVHEVASAGTAKAIPAGSWRRFAGWFSTLLADDGINARFAAERQRDEGLVRRVEHRHRP